MSPLNSGDFVMVNGDGDLAMDADIRPYIGKVLEVAKIAKSGLVVLKLPRGTISVPRRNLTPMRMASFSSAFGIR